MGAFTWLFNVYLKLLWTDLWTADSRHTLSFATKQVDERYRYLNIFQSLYRLVWRVLIRLWTRFIYFLVICNILVSEQNKKNAATANAKNERPSRSTICFRMRCANLLNTTFSSDLQVHKHAQWEIPFD